jgi:large subunit ribosomal protein L22
MKTAKATLGSFRQTPRKMRLVANAVRGKKVAEALVNLDFVTKKAASPIKNLILSALANAKALDIPTENLVIKNIQVNGGPIMYRRLPAARGSAHPMRKRTSSVNVELGEIVVSSKKQVSRKGSKKLKTNLATRT